MELSFLLPAAKLQKRKRIQHFILLRLKELMGVVLIPQHLLYFIQELRFVKEQIRFHGLA